MIITTHQIEQSKACAPGVARFVQAFPSGEGDYQKALDILARAGANEFALYLISEFGSDGSVMHLRAGDGRRKFVYTAGDVVAEAGNYIEGALYVGGTLTVPDGQLLVGGAVNPNAINGTVKSVRQQVVARGG